MKEINSLRNYYIFAKKLMEIQPYLLFLGICVVSNNPCIKFCATLNRHLCKCTRKLLSPLTIYDLTVFCYWSSDLKAFNLLHTHFRSCKLLVTARLGKTVK